jgi:hypothetical protein
MFYIYWFCVYSLHKYLNLSDKVDRVAQITVTCDCNALSTRRYSHNGTFPRNSPRLKTNAMSDSVMHDIQSETLPLLGCWHVHFEIWVLLRVLYYRIQSDCFNFIDRDRDRDRDRAIKRVVAQIAGNVGNMLHFKNK